jgi:hypothetical protein
MTSGITHLAGTPGITITSPGTYLVTFSVSGTEPNQFALFVNGSPVLVNDSPVPDAVVYGSGAGTQQNNGQAIITLAVNDVLTLQNHSSAAAVGLPSVTGGTQANVNASIVLEKLQ